MRKAVNSIHVAKPSGAYSPILKVGDFVFLSGLIGNNLDGKLPETLKEQLENIFKNTALLLSELNMNLNQVTTTTVYLKKGEDISEMDDIYQQYFKHPFPARTTVFVDKLTDDAKAEISFQAIDLKAYEIMNDCNEDGCNYCDDTDCEHY